tara:strand:+ start:48 stop:191 length:144 start_codon:yes stop_codon:yes gene_type:complete
VKIELTSEQANAVLNALLHHTKEDSVDFPSARVALIREVITFLEENK